MSLTADEKKMIRSFFDNNEHARFFVRLYNSYSYHVSGIRFIDKDSIIGFGRDGEHLRAYITKQDGLFYLKLKTFHDRIEFVPENEIQIKEKIFLNDAAFEENLELYLLSTNNSRTEAKSLKAKPQKSIELENEVLSKLNNRKKAKKYSRQEFTLLADWRYGRSFNDDAIIYVLPNGNEIQCDSKSEVLLLDYLINNQLTLEIGGQELYIPYDTAFKSERFYYPDVVVLTKDYRIAIIEVKPVTAMSYHLNMEKYTALKSYCEEQGYEYMMIDPAHDYMTFDELVKLKVPKKIANWIDDYLCNLYGVDGECLLDKNDIDKLYNNFSHIYKKYEIELYVHSLIIKRGWYNKYKNGFMVYENPQR